MTAETPAGAGSHHLGPPSRACLAEGKGPDVAGTWLLYAGSELVGAGVPAVALLDLVDDLQSRLDQVAGLMFGLVEGYVDTQGGSPAEVEAVLARLRPLMLQAAEGSLATALREASATCTVVSEGMGCRDV